MGDDIRVRLTWTEILVAAQVGCMRNVQSLRSEWTPAAGVGLENTWTLNIEGACGEMALAKHQGIYWTATIGDNRADDVGPYQVRTNTSRRLDDMILRDRDRADRNYVSVLSFLPVFVICGWISGKEGKQECWKRDGSAGRPPCYFVPRGALHPIALLQTDTFSSTIRPKV
jgi:hypothetical protein